MAIGIILKNLFMWMYFVAPNQLLTIWFDFIWFLYNFFSIRLLSTTLLSKWKQIGKIPGKRKGFEETLGTFIIDSFMRIVGFAIRSITILIGLAGILITILLGIIIFIAWFFLPIIIVVVFSIGTQLIIQ